MTSAPQKHSSFFSFPHPMNSSVARVVATGVVIMAVTTILLDQPWITLVLAFGFIARATTGPRVSPLAILASKVIVPKLGLPYRPVLFQILPLLGHWLNLSGSVGSHTISGNGSHVGLGGGSCYRLGVSSSGWQ